MLTDEQLRNRSRGIGGSDAAACVGESKWSTPRQLWHKKRNPTMAREMNEPMRWGHLLESVILDEYERRTGFPLTLVTNTLRHPEHEWMLANIDAWAAEQSIVVDAKNCRSSDGWGRPGTDDIPPDYWWQAQHYMAVIGCDQADIVVLFSGQDFQIYTVWADQESQENLIELERRLWQHVLDGTVIAGAVVEARSPLGYCVCVTCGIVQKWNAAKGQGGAPEAYRKWMEHVRFDDIDRLEKAKRNEVRKFSREEMVELRIGYMDRLKTAQKIMMVGGAL